MKPTVSLLIANPRIQPQGRYNLRFIVDVDRDEQISEGDYVTNTRYMFDGNAIPKNAKGEYSIVVKITPDSISKR